jgi:hypothetical protein
MLRALHPQGIAGRQAALYAGGMARTSPRRLSAFPTGRRVARGRHGHNPPGKADCGALPGTGIHREIADAHPSSADGGATLHLLCGKIGAGKSTLSQQLAILATY